jgi:hypothetical protein
MPQGPTSALIVPPGDTVVSKSTSSSDGTFAGYIAVAQIQVLLPSQTAINFGFACQIQATDGFITQVLATNTMGWIGGVGGLPQQVLPMSLTGAVPALFETAPTFKLVCAGNNNSVTVYNAVLNIMGVSTLHP